MNPVQFKRSRKAISKSKFYFFDLGVLNSILERKSLSSKTPEFGNLFETWVFLELKAYLEYKRKDEPLSFWRTHTGQEVDFVIGDRVAIEVKSSSLVSEKHFEGINALNGVHTIQKKIVVSLDLNYRKVGDIEIFPYTYFIDQDILSFMIDD